jgi:hypothetical protein
VVVIAATGDALFPFGYTRRVCEHIVALHKEMLVFDLDRHLIFNECVDEVLPRLVEKLGEYSPGSARGDVREGSGRPRR